MIRGIIFDCFGVLCQGSLDYFVSNAPADKRQNVIDTNHAADRGFIDHDEYVAAMASFLDVPTDEILRIMRVQHIRMEPVIEFARSLKPPYKLGLLSNVGGGVINALFTQEELTDLFDAVVLSGEVGMAKPYQEIFELTAERLGLRPDECLMIDDIPRNVEGAELAGMTGVVFGSLGQLRHDIEQLGLTVDNSMSEKQGNA